jgi:hypothetical protein
MLIDQNVLMAAIDQWTAGNVKRWREFSPYFSIATNLEQSFAPFCMLICALRGENVMPAANKKNKKNSNRPASIFFNDLIAW